MASQAQFRSITASAVRRAVPRNLDKLTGFIMFAAFAAYLFLGSVPPMASGVTVSEIHEASLSGEAPSNLTGNIGLSLLILALAYSLYRGGRLIATEYAYVAMGVVAFATLNMVVSATHSPDAFAQKSFALLLTVVCFLGMLLIWRTDTRQRQIAFRSIGYAIFISLAVGWLWHGTGAQRWVGAFNPNHFARFAVVALFLVTLGERRLRASLVGAALALCFVVSSRTMITGVLVFSATFYALTPMTTRGGSRAVIIFVLLSSVIIIDSMMRDDGILASVADQLALFSDDRGFNSGLSGRTETYATFTDQGPAGILLGSGFRATKYENLPLHSGVLKNMYDFGVPLAVAMYAFILSVMAKMLYKGRSAYWPRLRACGAFVLASLFMTFSEPDAWFIGFGGSMAFMLALTTPLYPIEEEAFD